VTDEELEKFEDAMEGRGEELREALAEDPGGDPDDCRKQPVADRWRGVTPSPKTNSRSYLTASAASLIDNLNPHRRS